MNSKTLLALGPAALLMTLVFAGCRKTDKESLKSVTAVSQGVSVATVEHDGHSFVVATMFGDSVSIIHSPACQCHNTAEAEGEP